MINVKLEGKEIAKLVCDLFSPLTEVAGVIGDQIRVYRQLSNELLNWSVENVI